MGESRGGALAARVLPMTLVAAAVAVALLVGSVASAGAVSPSNGTPCTILGTAGDDSFADVPAGEVACGFGGNDSAPLVLGTFYGGPGDDSATFVLSDGSFYGGPGTDSANVAGGFADGGNGDDSASLFSATFNGGNGNDTAGAARGSTFNGGRGDDTAFGLLDRSTFNGEAGDDHADALFLSTFNGGDGDDSAGSVPQVSTFNGGNGDDHLDTLDGGTFNGNAGYNTLCTFISGTYTDAVLAC